MQSEVSVNGSRGSSLPESDFGRVLSSQVPEFNFGGGVGIGEFEGVGGSGRIGGDLVDEGDGTVGEVVEGIGQDGDRSRVDGGVISIGNGDQVLLSNQLRVEELGGIRKEELILSGSEDQFGHIEESIVIDGVLNVNHVVDGRVGKKMSNSIVHVIGQSESPLVVASEDGVNVWQHILNWHNVRDDGNNSRINSSSQPCGPSSLRGSGNDELINQGNLSQ